MKKSNQNTKELKELLENIDLSDKEKKYFIEKLEKDGLTEEIRKELRPKVKSLLKDSDKEIEEIYGKNFAKSDQEMYNKLEDMDKQYRAEIIKIRKEAIQEMKKSNQEFNQEITELDKKLDDEMNKLIKREEQKATGKIKASLK